MTRVRPALAAILLAALALPVGASGVELHGYAQLWWTIREGAENGLRQPVTQDAAADVASGFLLRRARLAGDFRTAGLTGCLSLRLEGSPPALLDAYAVLPLSGAAAALWAGQMKIPATYEVETPDEALDLTTRSRLADLLPDYALSRSPSLASRLTGIRAYQRDLGVGLKGTLGRFRYFAMVGNGLGANHYIGGPTSRQEVFANSFGAYFYAARVACRLSPVLGVGGHASWNDHPNAVLDDKRTVLDIRRSSWSVDLHASPTGRLQFTAMYGAGQVDDDIDNDGRVDYRYRGWEAKLIAEVLADRLRVGLRYDAFAEESYESGVEGTLHAVTAGLTWTPRAGLRLQADYQRNILAGGADPDLDDDLLVVAGQVAF
jgi:hypothetical protein